MATVIKNLATGKECVWSNGRGGRDNTGYLRGSLNVSAKWLAQNHGVEIVGRNEDGHHIIKLEDGWEVVQSERKPRAKSKRAKAPADVPTPKPNPEPEPVKSVPQPKGDQTDEVASAIADALRSIKPQGGTINRAELREEIRAAIKEYVDNLPKEEVKVIKIAATGKSGQHPLHDKVKAMVVNDRALGAYPWLFGPAGSGKSTLCAQIAEELGLPFYSVSSLQQKYELEGYTDAMGKLVETTFYKCVKEGGIFLFDEATTTSGEVQVAYNSFLANLVYNFPKEGMVKAHPDCHVIAADNTVGRGASKTYSARFELDASTLDRYIPVLIDYTDEQDLRMAQGDVELVAFMKDIRKILESADTTYTASPRASKRIKGLQALGLFTDNEIIFSGLCGSWAKSDVKSFAGQLTGNNKYHKMFKSYAATL